MKYYIVIVIFQNVVFGELTDGILCDVRRRTEAGWVCGLHRISADGGVYESYRGVPYARQPVGELRFKELQPLEQWDYYLDAREEGPICIQDDNLYGDIPKPKRGMSEACIYANIHVPIVQTPQEDRNSHIGLPILVVIHGGGFYCGSGNTDLHGPEYVVTKGVIVMTFNYRLNIFGFLSLNTTSVPGNNGLRDMVTFLRWVRRNAKHFGGNPDDVTLMGQSVGAISAHILALSEASKGFFKRVILMSGTALPISFTTSPALAQNGVNLLKSTLGITATDPDEIHHILTKMPIERIAKANSLIQDQTDSIVFTPIIESRFPGVTTVLDRYPLESMEQGRGKEYPMIIGYTNNEGAFFYDNIHKGRVPDRIIANPRIVLPAEIVFTAPSNVSFKLGQIIGHYYFKNKEPTIEEVGDIYRDNFFGYPAFRVTHLRSKKNCAPTFLYQFSYEAENSVIKRALHIDYEGATHVEDQTQVLKVNSLLDGTPSFPPLNRDDKMKDWMTTLVVNFIKCNNPTCDLGSWPAVTKDQPVYYDIREPYFFTVSGPTYQQQQINLYNYIYSVGLTNRTGYL